MCEPDDVNQTGLLSAYFQDVCLKRWLNAQLLGINYRGFVVVKMPGRGQVLHFGIIRGRLKMRGTSSLLPMITLLH